MPLKLSFENILSAGICLMVFSLAFLFPFSYIFDQRIPLTDFLFLIVFALWFFGVSTKRIDLRFHNFFPLLGVYLLAILISVIFSANPKSSLIKFLGEVYLVFLCIIISNFITDLSYAKKIILSWLCGTIFVLMIGLLTLFLFYFDPQSHFLNYFQNHYGTVPVGNYPRIKGTFFHSNMLCNYLSVSLMLGFAAFRLGWLHPLFAKIFIGLILIISLFTFSPGLGGIALSSGIFLWLYYNAENKIFLSKTILIAGVLTSVFFLIMLVFAMQNHPTAPFVIHIPFTESEIYPSSRVMVWSATFETFRNNFWNGIGLGEDVCRVRYLNPSGVLEDLRDGHNTILNVSAQTGILGLISILAITIYLLKKIFNFKSVSTKLGLLYNCCGLAILSAFIYQGLGGSFEETRHIWVLFGLFIGLDKLINEAIEN